MRNSKWLLSAWSAVFLLASVAGATQVELVGVTPGRSATIVVDGGNPFTLMVGETIDQVRLVSADRDGAVMVVGGSRVTVPLGASAGAARRSGGGSSVTLTAGEGGHFVTTGNVNGRPIQFMVDTGASLIVLSRKQADRIGLAYRGGAPAQAMTANGTVKGWRVTLASVQVGSAAVRDVDGMVIDTSLPVALLGMSFLGNFDMQHQGSSLVLRRR
ncbi:MAG TPA: TIGR02281 family clan AA aspartic protease [Terriglobales bacterium]|nr:TIGR02281 family clan AA aspartic protease [Terriglobales bacterium]